MEWNRAGNDGDWLETWDFKFPSLGQKYYLLVCFIQKSWNFFTWNFFIHYFYGPLKKNWQSLFIIHQIYPPKLKNHKIKYYLGLLFSTWQRYYAHTIFFSGQRHSRSIISVWHQYPAWLYQGCWASIFLDIVTNLTIRKVRIKSFFYISKENTINYLKHKWLKAKRFRLRKAPDFKLVTSSID